MRKLAALAVGASIFLANCGGEQPDEGGKNSSAEAGFARRLTTADSIDSIDVLAICAQVGHLAEAASASTRAGHDAREACLSKYGLPPLTK